MNSQNSNTWRGKSGVYLIAEIGGNHEGNFDYALELTRLACESGVDAVKFQIYTGDSLANPKENEKLNQHFKRFELTPEQHIELAKYCNSQNVDYTASVWDVSAIEWIDPYMPWYKIGSGDFTALPVIEEIISKTRKPIMLSTGLCTFEEIDEVIQFIFKLDDRYKSPDYLSLLQCTTMYPIPDSDANLNVMLELRKKYPNLLIGYSDHTIGNYTVEIAVAMGAQALEMHFTDNRNGKTFRDHSVSFTKSELIELAEKIKKIKTLQGDGIKRPMPSEIEANHLEVFRRSIYAATNLPAGTVLDKTHLVYLRPNKGLDARKYQDLIGKTLNSDKSHFDQILIDDLE